MSWTAPRTWVDGEVVRARYFNEGVRDNLRALVGVYAEVLTSETTTSTAFTNLATVGPSVGVAITGGFNSADEFTVFFGCHAQNDTAAGVANMGLDVSGPTATAADDTNRCFTRSTATAATTSIIWGTKFESLDAGGYTLTAKYKVSAGTGTFLRRFVLAYPTGPGAV